MTAMGCGLTGSEAAIGSATAEAMSGPRLLSYGTPAYNDE